METPGEHKGHKAWPIQSDQARITSIRYANLTAQRLFEMTWYEITSLPSRLSAEPESREERARLLAAVSKRGFIEDYCGVRVSSSGRCIMIEQETV